MMVLKKRWMAMVVAAGLTAPMVFAEHHESETDKSGENTAQVKGEVGNSVAVDLLNQAATLVQYARENESPLAMLTAVQMSRRVAVRDGAEALSDTQTEAVEGEAEGGEAEKGSTPPATLDAATLLAEAKEWAEGDEHVLALIEAEAAKPEPSAGTLGAVKGPIRHVAKIPARTYVNYRNIKFRGGQLAKVAVIGDGDTDIDLYIYDQNNNLIRQDIDYTDRCYVQWTPKWTGNYRIRVANRGRVYNRVVILTN
ncbi:MAG: hypothetical protein AAGG38_13635 [Planctomycetota bacterium]